MTSSTSETRNLNAGDHSEVSGRPTAATTRPRLPGKQHQAVLTAARRPDQLLASRDDKAYWKGEPWFNQRTLGAVHQAGYADIRQRTWNAEPVTYEQTLGSLYLTAAGRAYARQHGVPVQRRRIVIITCGQKHAEPDYEKFGYRDVIPAGQLYIGQYHRSLRQAADALTDQSLIRVMSARHGLVPLDRPLGPYDVPLGSPKSITAYTIRLHAASIGLADADVIFLGGRKYADLLTASVPHALAPLTGGMGRHRGICRQAREDGLLRDTWWDAAAALFHQHQLRPGM